MLDEQNIAVADEPRRIRGDSLLVLLASLPADATVEATVLVLNQLPPAVVEQLADARG